jgi:hypothetical protein
MYHALSDRIRRSRTASSLAIIVIAVGVALSSGAAQARIAINDAAPTASALSSDVIAKVTGGGTVVIPTNAVASFGINARRPVGFVPGSGPSAEGRINYSRHKGTSGRHVNVPVVFMQATSTPQPPNNTGGEALLVGDCEPGTCPTGNSAIVYVKDVATPGTGQDTFQIYFCDAPPGIPGIFVPGQPIENCEGPEGGLLRSGNIQIRGEEAIAGEVVGSAAAAGVFSTTPNLNGVELAGGTFGIGARTAGPGDLEVQYNGVSLIGMFQQITSTGWVTTATVNGGTMTLTGTATLDMGDGSPPTPGLPLSASLTTSGVTVTVGSWSLPNLPKSDGFINIE